MHMDTLFSFAKENYQLISLLVGLIGVLVAFLALIHELKVRKRNKQKKDSPED